MHILILGSTGRTGRLLLTEALKRGHKVNVLVSHKSRLTVKPELVSAFEGTPLNRYTLAESMQGCEAILSTLNISRTSDFPWAKLRTSRDFLSVSMKNILTVAEEQKVDRIIITTAWGVAETKKDLPSWFRLLIRYSNIRYPYRDHELQEELLKHSELNYTVVRPAALTDQNNKKKIQVTLDNTPKPTLTISRLRVAEFMLDVLEGTLYNRQFPVISEI